MAQVQAQRQTQAQSQKQITLAQSIAHVRLMMEASLGCITYLRGLLPEENFQDDQMDSTADKHGGQRSLKFKKIRRGCSTEGDRIMDYLDIGVMDAIERKYLRSMVFSVYLDPDDSANVIETYTFNFSYCEVPQFGIVPVMTFEQSMRNMSVHDYASPPVPKSYTNGAVKKSIKNLIKKLILTTQQFEELPRKRLVSIKLFYQDHTPDDYHPPMFRLADPETERLYFATHERDEAPELMHLGKVETGHHSLQVKIRSVAEYLPKPIGNADDLPFGTPSTHIRNDAATRRLEDDRQLEDAETRKWIWSAEDEANDRSDLEDTEPDRNASQRAQSEPKPIFGAPFAVRVASDRFQPLPIGQIVVDADKRKTITALNHSAELSENDHEFQASAPAKIVGREKRGEGDLGHAMSEADTSDRLKKLIQPEFPTSSVPDTQPISDRRVSGLSSHSLSPLNRHSNILSSVGQPRTTLPPCQPRASADVDEDPISSFPSMDVDSIASFGSIPMASRPHSALTNVLGEESQTQTQTQPETRKSARLNQVATQQKEQWPEHLPCWCGDKDEDGPCVYCDEFGCKRLMHVWCIGAKDAQEFVGDEVFICPMCRIRKDPRTLTWNETHFETAVQAFRGLALFRRALRVVQDERPPANLNIFSRRLGCQLADARTVLARLEEEGFVFRSGATKKRGKALWTPVRDEDHRLAAERYFDRTNHELEDDIFKLPRMDEEMEETFLQEAQVPPSPTILAIPSYFERQNPPATPPPSSFRYAPLTRRSRSFLEEDNDEDDEPPKNKRKKALTMAFDRVAPRHEKHSSIGRGTLDLTY